MNVPFVAMWMPGPVEWVVIAGVALLLFGRRLPDVARSLGKSIVEFKRGIRDVKDDVESQTRIDSNMHAKTDDKPETPRDANSS